MEQDFIDDEEDVMNEERSEEGDASSEDGFMEGYLDDDKVVECDECGTAVKPEKKVTKEIEGEEHTFCSKNCAQEFEESLG
jgi:hypothetical protein